MTVYYKRLIWSVKDMDTDSFKIYFYIYIITVVFISKFYGSIHSPGIDLVIVLIYLYA